MFFVVVHSGLTIKIEKERKREYLKFSDHHMIILMLFLSVYPLTCVRKDAPMFKDVCVC